MNEIKYDVRLHLKSVVDLQLCITDNDNYR